MATDYFSHKPRSFVSRRGDLDQRPSTTAVAGHEHGTVASDGFSRPDKFATESKDAHRGRPYARVMGYRAPGYMSAQIPPYSALNDFPAASEDKTSLHVESQTTSRPRFPRPRALLRLLLLAVLALLVVLGWRCEAVGCKGRAGGGMVGEYGYRDGDWFVGGGSVLGGVGKMGAADIEADADINTDTDAEDGDMEWTSENASWDNDEEDFAAADQHTPDLTPPENAPQILPLNQSQIESLHPVQPTGPVGELTGPIDSAGLVWTAQAAGLTVAKHVPVDHDMHEDVQPSRDGSEESKDSEEPDAS